MSARGLELTGFRELTASLDAMEARLRDERAVGAVVLQAVAPAVAAVRGIVGTGAPWRETGLTAADVTAAIAKDAAPGTVKVAIGARKRAFILRFLEYGTSRAAAYPALRPGWDGSKAAVRAAIVAGLRGLMGGAGGIR